MKKIIIIIIASLVLVSNAYALQQIAGPLVINVPIGGTGSAKYGLINDDNETITITLRAEGDVADYLSFPATVDLEPGKIVYTDITARIPADYDKPLGGNITGYLYALQEGKPGQVQINIQMQKSITIVVGQSVPQTVENPETVGTNQAIVLPTGLFALGFNNSVIIVILVIVIIVIMLVVIKKRRNKK